MLVCLFCWAGLFKGWQKIYFPKYPYSEILTSVFCAFMCMNNSHTNNLLINRSSVQIYYKNVGTVLCIICTLHNEVGQQELKFLTYM